MQKYLEKSSMFPEDLFTVVVQRKTCSKRPVALCGYRADGRQNSIWYRLDGLHFFLTKEYKDFICKINCVSCLIFLNL